MNRLFVRVFLIHAHCILSSGKVAFKILFICAAVGSINIFLFCWLYERLIKIENTYSITGIFVEFFFSLLLVAYDLL